MDVCTVLLFIFEKMITGLVNGFELRAEIKKKKKDLKFQSNDHFCGQLPIAYSANDMC